MKKALTVVSAALLLVATPAYAHRFDEYLQATLISVSNGRVHLEMHLTPGVAVFPKLVSEIDTDRDGVISVVEERAYGARVLRDLRLSMDGTELHPRLVRFVFASLAEMKEGRGDITLDFDAPLPDGGANRQLTFENRHLNGISVYLVNALVPSDSGVRITSQHRSYEQSRYQLNYTTDARPGLASSTWEDGTWAGFTSLVRLGMRHISEGTDHLLFLLVLLLPAPLVATGARWSGYGGLKRSFSQLVRITTAFTIGHSLSLAVAAAGWLRAPSAHVEVLIAVSILVSAVHAIRPIFPGREAHIAGGFGLVHGLAFATMISGIGIDPMHVALTVLGFNIGIELMQFIIILVTVPWLVLMARTRSYDLFRVTGGSLAGTAACAWIGERSFGFSNPFGTYIAHVADNEPVLLVLLATVALGAFAWEQRDGRGVLSARESAERTPRHRLFDSSAGANTRMSRRPSSATATGRRAAVYEA